MKLVVALVHTLALGFFTWQALETQKDIHIVTAQLWTVAATVWWMNVLTFGRK